MSTQEHPATETVVQSRRRGKTLVATVVAQSMEFYDFILYGTAASLVFGQHFFPADDPAVGVLASFATFAVGFIARPAGASIFGHIGDKFGRKPALVGTLLLMALSTTLVGLLPTYAMMGAAAPIALVVLRCAQGIAVGGQWGGSTLLAFEYAPSDRRGLYGSIPQLGVPIGLMSGTLIFMATNHFLPVDQFASWGWRVPFLLSIAMFPAAYYIHRYIEDAQSSQERRGPSTSTGVAKRSSVVEVFKAPRQMVLCAGIFVTPTIVFYVIVTGMVDYGTRSLGMAENTLLTAVFISMLGWTIGTVGGARISDSVGRSPVYAVGIVLAGAWSFALFPLVQTRSFPLILLGTFVGLLGVGLMQGPGGALFAEMFPPNVRYAGASLGYQVANIFGAGLAPLIMVTLLETTGTTLAVSVYMAAAAALSLIFLALIRRFARSDESVRS